MKFDNSLFRRLTVALSLLFVAAAFVQAASYEVFMVRGEVIYEFSGENLLNGTNIASGERVKFGDKDAFAILMDNGVRYTLSAKNLGDKFKPGEFVTVKKATKRGKSGFNARQAEVLSDQKKVVNYFNGSPFLLLKETMVKITVPAYPLNDEKYMFLRYKPEGSLMMATKKLKHFNGLVVLNPDDILDLSKPGVHADAYSSFELHHFGGVGKMGKVCNIDMHLVAPDGIRDEIMRYIAKVREGVGASDSIDEAAMKQEVLDYLCEYYGIPDQEAFEEWAQETIN